MKSVCVAAALLGAAADQCSVDENSRQDCGVVGTDQQTCEANGCCWKAVDPNPQNVPWCFKAANGPSPSPPSPPSPGPEPAPASGSDASNPTASRDAFVHLFEWSWADVAKECEDFLGPKGFTAVQVSPPMEHIQGSAWWTRYQPVTYKLVSRSGNEEEFTDMVNRCKKAGVGIYADAVINHIAAGSGTGTAGSSYGGRGSAIYSANDMHHNGGDTSSNCQINNYDDKHNVQYCDLDGLPDLCTSCDYVQKTVSGYLNHMADIGIAGFRIDAAKHQDAGELGQLLSRVNSKLWKFGEVISASGEAVTPQMYTSEMEVTEFDYFRKLAPNFKDEGKLGYLNKFGESWGLLPSKSAVVFTDNHDTQRGEAPLTYKDGSLYTLNNIFMLAHPYGYPKVMSSYYFNSHDQGPPGSPVHTGNDDVNCGNGKPWVCEHRWTPIANMVNWRRSAGTAEVSNWESPGGNTIAFCRGSEACVAMNRGSNTWSVTLNWPMPAGTYCDVVKSDDTSNCATVTVNQGGSVSLNVPGMSAVAIHTGKKRESSEIEITV